MTTKVRINGVTIETTGELESFLIMSALSAIDQRHVDALTPDEQTTIREFLASDESQKIIEDYNTRRQEYETKHSPTIRVNERDKATIADAVGTQLTELRKTLTASAADAAAPKYYETGIKIDDDGTRRYKLYYQCPECRGNGRHYVALDTEYVRCHTCKTRLRVTAAVLGEPHERDVFGNFMTAHERWDDSARINHA